MTLLRVRTLHRLFFLGWNARALLVDPIIQEQDRAMRAQSDNSEAAWAAKEEKIQREAQEDFIRHCGGKIHIKPSTIVPGEVVDVPPHAKRLAEIRLQYKNAYTPWSEEQDTEVTNLYSADKTIKDISETMARHPGGIRARLKKLGLTD